MNIEALIIFGVMAGMSMLRELWNRKEKKVMLDRVMARNYQEYEYYQGMFKEEVNEMKKLRDEARDTRVVEPLEDITPKESSTLLDSLEEDWNAEDIDMEKLKEKIGGSESDHE